MARVAIIVDQMFEDSELRVPYDRLKGAGHVVDIVGIKAGRELAGSRGEERIRAQKAVGDVSATDYDALVIPGGYSPDRLRTNADMVGLVRRMMGANKPVAAVCHAGSMLVEAKVAHGRTLTSWPSIKTDLVNAGARWVDREVVEDGNLITSRAPEDLEAFSGAILRQLDRGVPPRIEPEVGPEISVEERTDLH